MLHTAGICSVLMCSCYSSDHEYVVMYDVYNAHVYLMHMLSFVYSYLVIYSLLPTLPLLSSLVRSDSIYSIYLSVYLSIYVYIYTYISCMYVYVYGCTCILILTNAVDTLDASSRGSNLPHPLCLVGHECCSVLYHSAECQECWNASCGWKLISSST